MIIERELHQQLGQLAPEEQMRDLAFARVLATGNSAKASGQSLTRFAGAVPQENLGAIAQANEEGCKQVNTNEW